MKDDIWQIFPRALEKLTLMRSFYSKWKMCEFKIYERVTCQDNEEWCKIWRDVCKIDLSFQVNMGSSTNFDPSTQKSQKLAL